MTKRLSFLEFLNNAPEGHWENEIPLPCNCDDPNCKGWVTVPNSETCIVGQMNEYLGYVEDNETGWRASIKREQRH